MSALLRPRARCSSRIQQAKSQRLPDRFSQGQSHGSARRFSWVSFRFVRRWAAIRGGLRGGTRACGVHQETDEIVQVARTELLGVVGGHERLLLIFDALQAAPLEQMECAVECLELHREIVLVANEPGEAFAAARDDDGSSLARIEISLRIDDRIADISRRARGSVCGKVCGNKAALAADHVAFGAAGLSKEQRFAILWIARKARKSHAALKCAQVSRYGENL